MTLALGPHRLDALEAGTYALDGGSMFGIVPRPLWERRIAPDERHRVRLASRCLLVRTAGRTVLVGAGPGTWWSEKDKDLYGLEFHPSLFEELERVGTTPDEITDVIASHLEFDHAGGLVRRGDSGLELAFPNASIHVQRRHWRWATTPSDRDAKSHRPEILETLADSGKLHFVEGATELYPRLFLVPSEGHTVGMQLVRLESDDGWLVHCAALVPTSAHLEPAWHAAFDLYPLTVVEEKKMLVAEAMEDGGILMFEHDPVLAACRLAEEGGRPVVGQPVEFS